MSYPPSPTRFQRSCCPILELTADQDSQCIVGKILRDTSGRQLTVPVPRSTHITQFLTQPIPSAHMHHLETYTRIILVAYHPTWSFLVVLTAHETNKSYFNNTWTYVKRQRELDSTENWNQNFKWVCSCNIELYVHACMCSVRSENCAVVAYYHFVTSKIARV